MSNEEILNPSHPTTTGALLTEEVAMNPFTPLPSFYEMMLVEEAQRSAHRAIKDGLENLANQSSRQQSHETSGRSFFGKIGDRMLHLVAFMSKKYSPEIRLLITYLIERRSIMTSSATMAESIYGGRRSKLLNGNQLEPITRHDRTRLSLVLALSWYLDEKLESLFEQCSRTSSIITSPSFRERMKKLFLKVYPYLCMTKHGSVLAYQFLYLLGQTVYFHPTSHFLGLVVRRITQADMAHSEPSEPPKSSTKRGEDLQKIIPLLRQAAFWTISTTLILGWMNQLRQHVREKEREHQGSSSIPPPPDAPPIQLDPRQRIRIHNSGDVCPLCQQPWIAPSASPSGYVFCHKCLVLYVREHAKCPLTGMTCSEKDIVRIYEPQSLSTTQS